MYYFFTTKKEALSYISAVNSIENYKGLTQSWANPKKHPTKSKWAILASSKLEIKGKTPEKLTEDWTPPLDD